MFILQILHDQTTSYCCCKKQTRKSGKIKELFSRRSLKKRYVCVTDEQAKIYFFCQLKLDSETGYIMFAFMVVIEESSKRPKMIVPLAAWDKHCAVKNGGDPIDINSLINFNKGIRM